MKHNSLRWLIVSQFAIATAVALGMVAPFSPLREMPLLMLAVQGLPTALLIVLVAIDPAVESRRYRWGIVLAFVFSQLGGYLLGRGQFVPGVLGYLAANIAYLTAFTTGVRFAKRVIPFVVLGLCGATVLALAWPHIPSNHVIPVCLYAAAIVSVPAQAIGRSLVTRRIGAVAAALGTTLLLISDSAIAVDRFYVPFTGADLFIMSTYFAGQWLIATSVGRASEAQDADG
jgi:uncharacterized membrane protein YhhN